MQNNRRFRRATRIATAVVAVAAFLSVAGSGAGAQTNDGPSVSATGAPELKGADPSLGVEQATKGPQREYDEGDLPQRLRAMATEQWYESGVDMGQTIDCVWGTPAMLGRSWVGWFGDIGNTPTTTQPVYYTKIGWGVTGGCGGAYVHIEEFLPPGTQLAISGENQVICWHDNLNDNKEMSRFSPSQGCPQQPGRGSQGGLSFDPSDGTAAWPTAIGVMYEIWIPVKSTQPLDGINGNPCKSCIQAGVWFIDGNASPWGYPKAPVYVKGTTPTVPPAVSYPAPSIQNPTCCDPNRPGEEAGANLVGWIFTTGKPGTTEIQIDDDQSNGYEYVIGGGQITAADIQNLGPDIQQSWALQFSPDTQWYWRMCFTPNDGSGRKCGAEQTFKVSSPPDTTPPQTMLDRQPAKDSGTRSATFEFSSSKQYSTFQCRLDGGAWSACVPPLSYKDLPDGPHTFEVKAVSQAKVEDSTPASYTWTVNPPPDTTIASGPPAKTRRTSATFTFTSTEAGSSFKCKLDTVRWKDCSTGTVSYARLSRGAHTFAVKATDPMGKVDATPAKRSWKITR